MLLRVCEACGSDMLTYSNTVGERAALGRGRKGGGGHWGEKKKREKETTDS